MTTIYIPTPAPVFRAFSSTGQPLAGGLLYSYQAGTTTPLATYADALGAGTNANPTVLDSTGSAPVFLGAGLYKMILKDANNNIQWTEDNIQGGGYVSLAMQPVVQASSTGAALTLLGGVTAAQVAALIAAAFAPSGAIQMYGGATAPLGFLMCDGSPYSRTTYAALFAAIGTTFGVGDGTTTFNVPDYRGYFPRGYDSSGLVDPTRTLGSVQQDAIKSHTLTSTVTDTGHYHQPSNSGGNFKTDQAGGSGNSSSGPAIDTNTTTTATTGVSVATSYTGYTETTVKNLAVNFIIKT